MAPRPPSPARPDARHSPEMRLTRTAPFLVQAQPPTPGEDRGTRLARTSRGSISSLAGPASEGESAQSSRRARLDSGPEAAWKMVRLTSAAVVRDPCRGSRRLPVFVADAWCGHSPRGRAAPEHVCGLHKASCHGRQHTPPLQVPALPPRGREELSLLEGSRYPLAPEPACVPVRHRRSRNLLLLFSLEARRASRAQTTGPPARGTGAVASGTEPLAASRTTLAVPPDAAHGSPKGTRPDTLTRRPLGQPRITPTDPDFLRVQARVRLGWSFLRTATLSPCGCSPVPATPAAPLFLQAHGPCRTEGLPADPADLTDLNSLLKGSFSNTITLRPRVSAKGFGGHMSVRITSSETTRPGEHGRKPCPGEWQPRGAGAQVGKGGACLQGRGTHPPSRGPSDRAARLSTVLLGPRDIARPPGRAALAAGFQTGTVGTSISRHPWGRHPTSCSKPG